MGNPDRVRVSGPLAAFCGGFAAELVRLGYRPNAAANQLQLMAHLSRWMDWREIGVEDLSVPVLERFLEARRAAGYRLWRSQKALAPLMSHLRAVGAPPPPVAAELGPAAALLDCYREFLVFERGLTPQSARLYVHLIGPFVEGRVVDGRVDVASLSAADVIGFITRACPGRPAKSAKLIVSALRSFLGFLRVDGRLAADLASAVPAVARLRAGPPPRLDRDGVDRLLATCDRSTTFGLRDFAVLTLLSRLGLRAGEVAALSLDDIDWRAGRFTVTGKGNRVERMPLPADVGEAIAAWLRHGRPNTTLTRAVFTRVRAPHRQLSPFGVTCVVAAAGRRAELGKISARTLRHTAATAMVAAGAGLPEVGQVLRHRRLLTTSIYAKVDIEGLRELARLWPGGSRS